jgi:hypothetical protein
MSWTVLLPISPVDGRLDGTALQWVLRTWDLQESFSGPLEVLILNRTSDDVHGLIPATSQSMRVLDLPFVGLATALNRAMKDANGDLLFVGQEENLVHPQLLATHERLHRSVMVVYARETRLLRWGSDPLLRRSPDSWRPGDIVQLATRAAIRDRELVAERDLKSVGFTDPNAWMLLREGRTSIQRSLVNEVGSFDEALDTGGWYVHEDYIKRLHLIRPTLGIQSSAPAVHLPSRLTSSWPGGASQRANELANKHGDRAFLLFDMYFRENLSLAEIGRRVRGL